MISQRRQNQPSPLSKSCQQFSGTKKRTNSGISNGISGLKQIQRDPPSRFMPISGSKQCNKLYFTEIWVYSIANLRNKLLVENPDFRGCVKAGHIDAHSSARNFTWLNRTAKSEIWPGVGKVRVRMKDSTVREVGIEGEESSPRQATCQQFQ